MEERNYKTYEQMVFVLDNTHIHRHLNPVNWNKRRFVGNTHWQCCLKRTKNKKRVCPFQIASNCFKNGFIAFTNFEILLQAASLIGSCYVSKCSFYN